MSLFNAISLFYRRGITPVLTQTRRNFSIVDLQNIKSPSGEDVGAVFHGVNDQHEGETDAEYVERSRFDMLNAASPSLRHKSLLLLNTAATVVDAKAYDKARKKGEEAVIQELRSPRYMGHSMAAIVTISEEVGISIKDKTGISFVGENTLETPEAMMHSFFPNREDYQEMVAANSFQTMVLMLMDATTVKEEEVIARVEAMQKAAQSKKLPYDRLHNSCVHRVHEALTGKKIQKPTPDGQALSSDKQALNPDMQKSEPSSTQIGGFKVLTELFPQYTSKKPEDKNHSRGQLYWAADVKGLTTRSYEVDNRNSAQVGSFKMRQTLFPQYAAKQIEDEYWRAQLHEVTEVKGLASRMIEADNDDNDIKDDFPRFQP